MRNLAVHVGVASVSLCVGVMAATLMARQHSQTVKLQPVAQTAPPLKPTPDIVDETVTESDIPVAPTLFETLQEDIPKPVPEATGALAPTEITPDRETVRQTIRQFFPEIDDQTLDGWADSYQYLTIDELRELLTQKKHLPELFPSASFLSDIDPEVRRGASGTPPAAISSLLTARSSVRTNILNWTTPGYRRNVVHSIPVITEAGPQGLTWQSRRTFEAGQIQTSQNPLHMAISNHPDLMFRLEPGPVFTRFGAFVRLKDGTLGLLSANEQLRLFGDLAVPQDFRQLSLNAEGALSCTQSNQAISEIGALQIARIFDVSQLKSKDGVFFHLPEALVENGIEMVPGTTVILGALESSNVSPEAEARLDRHLEQISDFSEVPAE